MRVKKVKVAIKNLKDIFEDVKDVVKRIEGGAHLKTVREPEIYFTSFEAFRKALTPKRLELLHIIKIQKPSSINGLARLLKRDIKNVAEDVKYLRQLGFIEVKGTEKKTMPVITYDKINLEIAI